MAGIDPLSELLHWRLLKGSHDWPGPDGGTCINEAAVVAWFQRAALEPVTEGPWDCGGSRPDRPSRAAPNM
jgi:hypothetical protein